MAKISIETYLDGLHDRIAQDGGLTGRPGGRFRPDATAWAILALGAAGITGDLYKKLKQRLAQAQSPDGRISLGRYHGDAVWPTPIAVLAWAGDDAFAEPRERAVEFLLGVEGKRNLPRPGTPFGHDTTIRGWSWILGTHAWVEPTALCLLALRATGRADHSRAKQAMRLLKDRQLPSGGWNYGNTLVFETELRPDPESTGTGLVALAGLAEAKQVAKSLDYAARMSAEVRSPLALGWAVLGLSAWGESTGSAAAAILGCLNRQERLGPFDTAELCVAILGYLAATGAVLSPLGREANAHVS